MTKCDEAKGVSLVAKTLSDAHVLDPVVSTSPILRQSARKCFQVPLAIYQPCRSGYYNEEEPLLLTVIFMTNVKLYVYPMHFILLLFPYNDRMCCAHAV